MSAATPPSPPEPDPAKAAAAGDPARSGAPVTGSGAGFGPAISASVAEEADPAAAPAGGSSRPRKGPLSFLSGALTSALLAWLCLGLSQKVVGYYAEHPPHYSAQIAQSIATALKTLIVGMCFLATFSFAFIGLGLALTFVRSLLPGYKADQTS